MTTAIIVAAGRGTRMGPDVDKLFLLVAGAPVITHTWRRFEVCPEVDRLVLVVRAGMESAFRELAAEHGFLKPFQLVAGGAERQDSVWNGLAALPDDAELVAIQDGARPCTPLPLIARTGGAQSTKGSAVRRLKRYVS